MPENPSFLRKQATEKKGPPGTRNKTAMAMVMQAIEQVVAALKGAVRPDAPAQKRSASPLAGGPLGSVKRGPTPPPGAIRHDHSDDNDGGENNN